MRTISSSEATMTRWTYSAGVMVALVVGWLGSEPSRAQEAIFFKIKRIDQDKLLHGDYPLRQVVENGRHLFSTPFTKDDGYGEGGRVDSGVRQPGPREAKFQMNLVKLKEKLGATIAPRRVQPAAQLRAAGHQRGRRQGDVPVLPAQRARLAELLRVPQLDRLGAPTGHPLLLAHPQAEHRRWPRRVGVQCLHQPRPALPYIRVRPEPAARLRDRLRAGAGRGDVA